MVYMVFIPSRIYYEVATTYQVPGISTTYTITITTYHIPLELTTGPGVMRPRESVLFADFEYKITLANVK